MPHPSRQRRSFVAGSLSLLALLAACTAADPAPPAKVPATDAPPASAAESAPAEPTAAQAASATPAAPPAKRAALRFELEGEDFPSPLVDVMVSGQPTTMLVDTGASHQVVSSWVAEQIGATRPAGGVGLDHAGKTMAISRLEGATIVVSGWGPIDASEAVVVALPDALKKHGLGGVLSPQALVAEGRAVVLDFRRGTMTDAPLQEALRALDAEPGTVVTGEMKSCGPGGGALPYVRADVGGTAVDAQLDTGATQTTVRAASSAGAALSKRAKGASSAVVASGTYTVASAEGTRVKLGSLEVDTDVALVPKTARPVCPNDAQLGMDVLRRCVLVLGTSTLAGKCAAPPG